MTEYVVINCGAILQTGRLTHGSSLIKGKDMAVVPSITNAWLHVKAGKIEGYGSMDQCPSGIKTVDANGGWLFPTFCDSHTHLVFAKPRSAEYVARIQGKSYHEIAAEGGGILNSAKHLAALSEDVLYENALERLHETISYGTGLIEIKSGYGLSEEAELKMLRVIKRLKAVSPIPIKATFLAAHALPATHKNNKAAYLDLMLNSTLPKVAEDGLADYIDAFCETGFFDASDIDRLLTAGKKYGLKGKIHTNQFTHIGGIEMALQHEALSVDHLEVLNDEEIALLSKSALIPTLLPQAPFFLNDEHFPPMRKMIEQGLGFALATDFNPGTSPSSNMQFVMSIACIKGRILPEEALNAATYNGACALEEQDNLGSIDKGKVASFCITKPIQSLADLSYFFASNTVKEVYIAGKQFQ